MKLSIVIPAYNEEDRLSVMLDDYLPYFSERYGNECELIVVVNGSRDKTEEIAKSYMPRFPILKVLVEPKAVGKGGAIMMGFNHAAGELIGFVDADDSTRPAAFQDLVEQIGDAGAIIASRRLKGAVVSPRQPLKRRLASRVFNGLVRCLFHLPITDTQCGAKLMKRDAVRAVMPRLGLTRWAFDVDLLFQLRRARYPIIEIPTVWRDIGGSKLKVARASFEMFLAICRLRLLHSPFRWVVTAYNRTFGFIRLRP